MPSRACRTGGGRRMTDIPDSSDVELQARLERLARSDETWTSAGRVVLRAAADPISVLRAILDEIDDTVLSVRLDFEARPEVLSLLAGGRRLRSAGGEEGFDPEDDVALAAVAGLLHAFAKAVPNGAPITVVSTPMPHLGSVSGAGIAVERLAVLLDVGSDDSGMPFLAGFLSRCASAARVAVLLDGDDRIELEGDVDEDLQDEIETMTGGVWRDLEATRNARPTATGAGGASRSLTFWLPTDGAGAQTAIGVARDEDPRDRAIFAFDPGDVGSIQAAWAKSCRQL